LGGSTAQVPVDRIDVRRAISVGPLRENRVRADCLPQQLSDVGLEYMPERHPERILAGPSTAMVVS
jgi:hypothetical protein